MPLSCSPVRTQVQQSLVDEKPKPPPPSAKPNKVQKNDSQEQLMSEMNNRLKQRQENGINDGEFKDQVKVVLSGSRILYLSFLRTMIYLSSVT